MPYVILSGFNQAALDGIDFAFNHWGQNAGIQFVPKQSYHQFWIKFTPVSGSCYSYLGLQTSFAGIGQEIGNQYFY